MLCIVSFKKVPCSTTMFVLDLSSDTSRRCVFLRINSRFAGCVVYVNILWAVQYEKALVELSCSLYIKVNFYYLKEDLGMVTLTRSQDNGDVLVTV